MSHVFILIFIVRVYDKLLEYCKIKLRAADDSGGEL